MSNAFALMARATICITAVPPGTTVTGAASTLAPADATCACTSAVHVPAPRPADDDVPRAREWFRAVRDHDPDFADVRQRLRNLG